MFSISDATTTLDWSAWNSSNTRVNWGFLSSQLLL